LSGGLDAPKGVMVCLIGPDDLSSYVAQLWTMIVISSASAANTSSTWDAHALSVNTCWLCSFCVVGRCSLLMMVPSSPAHHNQ
jgi:hypothetical protein